MSRDRILRGLDLGQIVEYIRNILGRYFKPVDYEVKGEVVEKDLYWIDIDIKEEAIRLNQLNDLADTLETGLGNFGLKKDKLTLTKPAENASLHLGFSLPYHEKVTIGDLINVGLIRPSEVIFGYYNRKRYEATITPDGKIQTLHDGEIFRSLSSAAGHIVATSQNGWYWWKYRDKSGKELWITTFRDKYRQLYDC